MTSPFAALENAAWRTWNAVMGESFEHQPMVAAPGGGLRSIDGSRAVVTVIGVLEAKEIRSTEFGSEARGSTPATLTRPLLHLDGTQYAALDRPARHDRFERVATGDIYEVAQVERDAEGRIKLSLKHIDKVAP